MSKLVICVLVLCAATGALCQFTLWRGSAPADVQYLPVLLESPPIAADLGLTRAQRESIHRIIVSSTIKLMPYSFRSGHSNQTNRAVYASAFARTQRSIEALTTAKLSKRQRARFHQITLQFIGGRAALMPQNAKAIGLTAAQRATLGSKMKAIEAGMFPLPGKPEARTRLVQATLEREDNVLRHSLTKAQWARWRAMLGKPYRTR
jgi:hypothetical protein